ncbi:MAG: carbohydrate ABC transporter permease [Micrococcales bacterium]
MSKTKSASPWRTPSAKAVKRKNQKPDGVVPSLQGRWGYLFTAPFTVMFLIFGLAPVIYSVYIAFFQWDPLDFTHSYIGLKNFQQVIVDDRFWLAVQNTFQIWALSTFPQMILAIALANVLRNPKLRFKTFWRTILLVPNITSVLAVAIVFGQLFSRDFGLVNLALGWLGFTHHIDFVSEAIPGQIAIATMITWRWLGYNALIFLAAMLAVPNELYEAAAIDGANRWRQFTSVTLPGIRNTITFVLVVGTIGGLQVFAEPLTLAGSEAGGDSRQFSTLTLFLYEQAHMGNWGYAATIGIMITFIVLIISGINFLITRRIGSGEAVQ